VKIKTSRDPAEDPARLSAEGGTLRPDPARCGLGLDVRWRDLELYRVFGRSPE